ncbi:type II secretion system F family protein [Arthrobacter glacialis]|uniref:type II secretion system F family protein n=1 Tax=Arthrobacter glacialis TaxID=1664 RepID=UPI000CD3BBED|nr:type II secretion system F family protein [Arthrobacter glacialis]POH61062.1 secretion system protein [Arthrobacter glacialis]
MTGSILVLAFSMVASWCLWGESSVAAMRAQGHHDPSGPTWQNSQAKKLVPGVAGRKHRRQQPGGSDEPAAGIEDVPLLLELLGTALDTGLTVPGALRLVAGVSAEHIRESLLRVVAGLEIGASWHNAWEGNMGRPDVAQIHTALSFAALTGAAAAPLLHAQAQQYRRTASRQAEKRAAALGVKLVVPLGLCSLPAFIALGVVPVVMAMIPAL